MDNFSETLKLQVPLLRAYAFCLLGNRAAADNLAETALLSLQPPFEVGNLRLKLLKTLYSSASGVHSSTADDDGIHNMHRRFVRLALIERHVLLLTWLEIVTLGQIAEITNLPVFDVWKIKRGAILKMARLQPHAIIIEDEFLIAQELADVLEGMGIQVCGTAKSKFEALNLVQKHHPQLLLVDYRLCNGDNGVDIVRSVREEYNPAIIFVTAYANAAIMNPHGRAGEIVLQKPVHLPSLIRAVSDKLAM